MDNAQANPGRSKLKRWLKLLVTVPLVLASFLLLLLILFNEPLPPAMPGPAADDLARKMLAAINDSAWQQTGAVAWEFGGRHDHIWDRKRHLSYVRWGECEVWQNLSLREGIAKEKGVAVTGKRHRQLLDKAWGYWANDSFWLNPVSKVFDKGVRRGLVQTENNGQGLLMTFEEGGVTPGDSYLWLLDENSRPVAWKMWVSIIPVGGIQASWQGWLEQSTGVWMAGQHKLPILMLELKNIRCATDLSELFGDQDPFSKLQRKTLSR